MAKWDWMMSELREYLQLLTFYLDLLVSSTFSEAEPENQNHIVFRSKKY